MIALIVLGCILGYIFLAGLTFGLVRDHWVAEDCGLATVFWPITLCGWIVYQIATAGPRLIEWKRRPKLPKARIV